MSEGTIKVWNGSAWLPAGATGATGPQGAPGATTAGPWSSLGSLAGFSVTAARWRVLPWGDVQMQFFLVSSGTHAISVTFTGTIAAAYWPTMNIAMPLATSGGINGSGVSPARVVITTSGQVVVQTSAANTASGTQLTGAPILPVPA